MERRKRKDGKGKERNYMTWREGREKRKIDLMGGRKGKKGRLGGWERRMRKEGKRTIEMRSWK